MVDDEKRIVKTKNQSFYPELGTKRDGLLTCKYFPRNLEFHPLIGVSKEALTRTNNSVWNNAS